MHLRSFIQIIELSQINCYRAVAKLRLNGGGGGLVAGVNRISSRCASRTERRNPVGEITPQVSITPNKLCVSIKSIWRFTAITPGVKSLV